MAMRSPATSCTSSSRGDRTASGAEKFMMAGLAAAARHPYRWFKARARATLRVRRIGGRRLHDRSRSFVRRSLRAPGVTAQSGFSGGALNHEVRTPRVSAYHRGNGGSAVFALHCKRPSTTSDGATDFVRRHPYTGSRSRSSFDAPLVFGTALHYARPRTQSTRNVHEST